MILVKDQIDSETKSFHSAKSIGLWAGVGVAALLQLFPAPDGLSSEGWVIVSLALWMAIWWITEAVPIGVTSLLPIVIVPLSGVLPIKEAVVPYSSPIVLLLMGGFIAAKSIEKWNLHTRLALNIVVRVGDHPKALIAGFLMASAVLSMWISNTATTIMLAPIGLSVARAITGEAKKNDGLVVAVLLAIAYGASIGGLGTPVGTPTNLIVIGYLQEFAQYNIDFAQWMSIGLPMVAVMLPAAWFVLTHWGAKIASDEHGRGGGVVQERLDALGKMSTPEFRTLITFSVIAILWIVRRPLNGLELFGATPFQYLTDHIIAIGGAILMFVVPAGKSTEKGTKLLDWDNAKQIPWEVVLLFGGGLSLALGISESGLALWLATKMGGLTSAPTLILILVLVSVVIFSTEIVSNVATATATLPILGAMAGNSGMELTTLAVPVAMAASCAFMLPMATGPNAIVFGTGRVSMSRMASIGLKLNILGVGLITTVLYWLMPIVFS
ncbi:SLC13 family permease [Hirschia maritima]|uniref:SLC13 family permease n=1 Tax=Hirschia maritima TaxID=1121961 RepID=UPI0003826D81